MRKLFTLVVLMLFLLSSISYAMPKVKAGGDLRFNYNHRQNGIDTFDFYDGTLNTDSGASRARLRVEVEADDDISFVVQANAVNNANDITIFRLEDAYADLKVKHGMKFRMGKFKVPFGYDIDSQKTALVSSYLQTGDINVRDYGVGLFGVCPLTGADFMVAMLNGAGGTDINNGDKDVAGKMVFKLPAMMKLGVSGYYGKTGVAKVDKYNYGLYLMAKVMQADLLAETVLGKDNTGTNNIFDAYVQLSKKIDNCEPLIKFDYYDFNTSVKGDAIATLTLGTTRDLTEKSKLVVNYNLIMEETLIADNNTAQIQLRIDL